MDRFALLAQLRARPGKERAVEEFFASARPLVLQETGTTTADPNCAFVLAFANASCNRRDSLRKGSLPKSHVFSDRMYNR
jgi:hypothetical protein